MKIDITITDNATGPLQGLRKGIVQRGPMHARIAAEAEEFIKAHGAGISASEHRSANRLGAKPTGHLARAYQAIESGSDDSSAFLRVPRASRLRAAFGDYVVRPGSGKKYLTVAVHPEAYGRRAGEFRDLFFVRLGPRQTPALARKAGTGMEVMYWLTRSATIKQDRGLIPFEGLASAAQDAAEAYLDALMKPGTANLT